MAAFKTIYRRRLPHIQTANSRMSLTFRLQGSLPSEVVTHMLNERASLEEQAEKESSDGDMLTQRLHRIRQTIYLKYDRLLEGAEDGPTWLAHPDIAELVCSAIHQRDPLQFELIAYSIMPNHVHLTIQHFRSDLALYEILGKLKGGTAFNANKILGRKGTFWQSEGFDHVLRDSRSLARSINYTLANPVHAGLVSHWREWPYSFVAEPYLPLVQG